MLTLEVLQPWVGDLYLQEDTLIILSGDDYLPKKETTEIWKLNNIN